MKRPIVMVTHQKGSYPWKVQSPNASVPPMSFNRQDRAIDMAVGYAKPMQATLKIQGRDGRFRDERTYGSDPYPPRG